LDIARDWICSNGVFAQEACRELRYKSRKIPCFFSELANAINAAELSKLIGPSLLGSEFIEFNRPPGSSMMTEFTAFDERANVLRFITADNPVDGNTVETHWCLSEENGIDGEKRTVMICKKICPSVQNPPVHQGTTQHNQPQSKISISM